MSLSRLLIPICAIATLLVFTAVDKKDNWTQEQLISGKELAAAINQKKAPLIINIGPAGNIKSAKEIGAVNTPEKLETLRAYLQSVKKDKEIVVYCGCCPFKNCPNIRPAIALLAEMGFEKTRLLDIPDNLKVDWIDKGYPMD